MNPKFCVGDIVLFHDGLFRVLGVNKWNDFYSCFTYRIGDLISVPENQLKKADWRDITRISKIKN